MYHIRKYFIIILVLIVCSCYRHHTPSSEPILRVDLAMAEYARATEAERIYIADSLGPEIEAMMSVSGIADPDERDLLAWSESKVVEMFQPAVDSVFADISPLEQAVGGIVRNAGAEALLLPHFSFASVVWGSRRPIVRVDSIMLIALNHYLGADYPGYAGWQQYRVLNKMPEMIPYDLAGAIAATQYPMTDSNPTLLSWMIYEGALVEARMRLVPEASLARALGFTDKELDYADRHIGDIWQEMQIKRIIYDTDPMTIDRYISPAPSTPLLQGTSPGRIGRYVGYRIVRAYLKKYPDTMLAEMLSPDFYSSQSTLIDSNFH